MQNGEAPPGAIIPARVGEIGFDLPDGWWLMRGRDANKLDADKWETTDEFLDYDQTWYRSNGWPVDDVLIVRRRTVRVTVTAMPGDRVVVLSPAAMEGIPDLGYGRERTPNTDAFYAAVNNAVVVE